MSNDIQKNDVEKIAALARLALTPAEKEVAAHELGAIIEYIDRLSEVKTEGMHPFIREAITLHDLREDVVIPFEKRDALLPKDHFSKGLMVTKGVFSHGSNKKA